MSDMYILNGHTAIPCDDIMEWAKCLESSRSHLAQIERDGIKVSTVFLGLDHNFGEGPPLLFETMIFGGEYHEYMDRYSTWEEAEKGHSRMCEKAFGVEAQNETSQD